MSANESTVGRTRHCLFKRGARCRQKPALRATRYKDAIDHYKALLRTNTIPVGGNLSDLCRPCQPTGGQGHVQEALALWRTRAEICAVPLVLETCLRLADSIGRMGTGFGVLSGTDRPEVETGRAQLARVALARQRMSCEVPAHSPLLLHRSAAPRAAYSGSDASVMPAHLASIPFRFPFRDLRAILKALLMLPTDVEQATAAIGRVPAGGPFEPLAAALRVCVLPRDEWLARLGKLDKETRALVLDIKGCPPEQRAAIAELSVLREEPAAVYDLVARHRQVFPPGAAEQLCLRLLAHVPDRIKAYRANFVPLPAAGMSAFLPWGRNWPPRSGGSTGRT